MRLPVPKYVRHGAGFILKFETIFPRSHVPCRAQPRKTAQMRSVAAKIDPIAETQPPLPPAKPAPILPNCPKKTPPTPWVNCAVLMREHAQTGAFVTGLWYGFATTGPCECGTKAASDGDDYDNHIYDWGQHWPR